MTETRVKNKNTKISSFIFLVWLVAIFFGFGKNSLAEEKHLIINEIQTSGGTGKSTNEFIELYNPTDSDINLSGYKLTKKTSTGTESNLISSSKFSGVIPSHDYFLISPPDYKDTISADLVYSGSSYSISNNNTILLYNSDETLIDKVGFGTAKDFEAASAINTEDGKSIERKSFKDTDNNAEDFSLQNTPSPTNSKSESSEESDDTKDDSEKDEPTNYAGKLKINEILPAPKTQNTGKEFVEIINVSTEIIDLAGMWIEDEKNHKVSFPEKTIAPKELFILEGNFELNNTSSDSAFLIAKDGAKESPIDSVNYEKPKYDYAYAFDGTAWQWTSKVTKGVKNEFDKLLAGKIKKDEKIYANVYANFEVSTDKKAQKFTWNFGDGHKSYLKKTRHKYEKTGTYDATLKITGDGKENLLSFTVKVEKFGKAKVQIISLSPNPAGIDSSGEWLEILNNTKKKVNLKNWSVATGWKKLANHPIKKDFILKAGESKKLTRELCAFSLGNKQAKIELRYPDGKVADKIKYDRKNDSISEDELYQKAGGDWQWVSSQKDTEEKQTDTELKTTGGTEIKPPIIVPEVKIEEPEKADFDLSDLGKSTKNPAWRQKQENQIALLFAGSNISPTTLLFQNQGRVLGISTTKFISKNTTAPKSSDYFWKKINAKLNELILMF